MKFTVMIIALVCLLAPIAAQAQFQPPGDLAPSTNKANYAVGENVGLILTNQGMGPVTWSNPPSVMTSCFVYDGLHRLIFDGSQLAIAAYVDPVTINPGQSTMVYWHQDRYLGGSSTPVGPGTYYFATTKTSPTTFAQFTIGSVPEPSSVLALFTGLSGLGGLMLRRRRG